MEPNGNWNTMSVQPHLHEILLHKLGLYRAQHYLHNISNVLNYSYNEPLRELWQLVFFKVNQIKLQNYCSNPKVTKHDMTVPWAAYLELWTLRWASSRWASKRCHSPRCGTSSEKSLGAEESELVWPGQWNEGAQKCTQWSGLKTFCSYRRRNMGQKKEFRKKKSGKNIY